MSSITPTRSSSWPHRLAVALALVTFPLIWVGGLVTTYDAGMAVPDWPTTYGYNMFLFPISQWVGGIFYEHSHRLVASTVGLLVVFLTRWLGGKKSRGPLAVIGPVLAGGRMDVSAFPAIDAPVSSTELPSAITKASDEPASEPPAPDDAPPPTVEAPEPDVSTLAPGDIRNAPQVSADDVAKSVEAAASGNLAWDADGTSSPSVPIKREFYFSLSKLGEALTFADRVDEAVTAQTAETVKLLQEIVKHPDKLAVIGSVANGWIAAGHETRKTNGICLAGIVKSVEPIGSLFETTIESAGQQIAEVEKAREQT
jgi:hypothetical protein